MNNIFRHAQRIAAAFIIITFGSYIIAAQSEIAGEWTAKAKAKDGEQEKIYISFKRTTDGGKNQFGSTFDYADVSGLAPGQSGPVSFTVAREAGTIIGNGNFTDGKGSGTFRFSPNMGFVSSMKARGFDFESAKSHGKDSTIEERLFTAATLNVTTALADDLRSSGFQNLEVDDLYKAAIFKIDGKFMAEMAATGFPNLTMEDLVKARIFKIDAAYVRDIRNSGLVGNDFEQLVKYRIFKVTPEFLNELRAEGLTNLDAEEVVKLRIFKIDAAYVRQARAENPNITVEQMVKRKIGVWRDR